MSYYYWWVGLLVGLLQRTKTQGIPYLSFNNLNLLLEKPLALVLLILLLLLFRCSFISLPFYY